MTTLDGIESSLSSSNCDLIPEQVQEFVDQVNALPGEVDDEVEQGLNQAATNLVELSQEPDQCEPVTGQGGVEPETTSPEVETSPTTTDTETETDTDTEADTTTETETDEEEPPPEEDEGEGTPPAELPDGSEGGTGSGGRGSDSGGLTGEKGRGS